MVLGVDLFVVGEFMAALGVELLGRVGNCGEVGTNMSTCCGRVDWLTSLAV